MAKVDLVELQKLVESGHLTQGRHFKYPELSIFNYTPKTQYGGATHIKNLQYYNFLT